VIHLVKPYGTGFGNVRLCETFPRLYRLDLDKEALVYNWVDSLTNQVRNLDRMGVEHRVI